MTPKAGLMLTVVLAASPAVFAQDIDEHVLGLLPIEQSQWRHFDLNISPTEYESAYHHNRRFLRNRLKDTMLQLGIPEKGINVIGAAAALTVTKTKIPLNKSDTLAIELKELIDDDRKFMLRFKVDWQ